MSGYNPAALAEQAATIREYYNAMDRAGLEEHGGPRYEHANAARREWRSYQHAAIGDLLNTALDLIAYQQAVTAADAMAQIAATVSRHGSFLIDVDPTEDERERIGHQLMTVAYSLAHYLNSTTDAEVPDGLKRWCMGDEGDPFGEEGGGVKTSPDAELLALGERWSAHYRDINQGVHTVDGAITDEASERDHAMRWEIAKTPANTLRGVILKLHMAWDDLKPEWTGIPVAESLDECKVAERAVYEALDDLVRMTASDA